MKCFDCDTPLTGGLDTYGDVGEELCWNCYAERNACAGRESWYGLAPHEHTYDEKGNIIIGGTKFLPLVAPRENGVYDFGDRTFTPTDGPFHGIWELKPLAGWR